MLPRSPACPAGPPATLLAPWPVAASAQRDAPLVLIRDAETETLLRTFANPLFRAAGLSSNLVRIHVVEDPAINSFVSTGNRMFIDSGLLMKATSALEVVGVIAHETGHIRMPEAMQEAMAQSIASLLVDGVGHEKKIERVS